MTTEKMKERVKQQFEFAMQQADPFGHRTSFLSASFLPRVMDFLDTNCIPIQPSSEKKKKRKTISVTLATEKKGLSSFVSILNNQNIDLMECWVGQQVTA